MLCVSICEPSVKKILSLIRKSEIAEVRLDLMDLSDQDIEKVFSGEGRIIATCCAGKFSDGQRKNKLKKAIESGASYVDIEIDAPDAFKKELISSAHKHNCKVILSYHNFNQTPPTDALDKMVDACFAQGADIAKVACLANSESDAARILSLYAKHKNLVALGMGEKGKITRVASLLLGAPFSYVATGTAKETAPGQITKKQMEKVLEGLAKLNSVK
jgi:3-dehydroquinate dehydratase-1